MVNANNMKKRNGHHKVRLLALKTQKISLLFCLAPKIVVQYTDCQANIIYLYITRYNTKTSKGNKT